MTLTYCQINPLNRIIDSGTGATSSSYYYATNAINDPDQTTAGSTLGGHKPFYTTQLGTLYKRYSVLSATATLEAAPTLGSYLLFGRVDRQFSGGAITGLTAPFDQADLERPGTVNRMAVPGQRTRMTLRWNCKGSGFTRDNNVGFVPTSAGGGSDPAMMDYFRFGASTMTAGGASGTTPFGSATLPSCMVRIRYKVLFTDPVDQTIS